MAAILIALLFANALFNFLVWPTFYRRVANDPRARNADGTPTRFLTVHRALIGTALALGAASAVAAVVALL